MGLKCPKCGSINTVVVDKESFAKKTRNEAMLQETCGKIDPKIIIEIIKAIIAIIGMVFALFTAKQKNKKNILLCKDCGHWEDA